MAHRLHPFLRAVTLVLLDPMCRRPTCGFALTAASNFDPTELRYG
jgi:hypothetical protein